MPKLASSSEDGKPKRIQWEILTERSIDPHKILWLDKSSTSMDPLCAYLADGTLPSDSKEANRIKRQANWFILYDRILHKRSYARPLLRYITPEVGKKILDELHEGMCSFHIGGHALAVMAIRTGYYWPSLREDALNLARTCDKC